MSDRQYLDDLRLAYDRQARARDETPVEPWKAAERERFLAEMRAAGCETLLEVGAGPGTHGLWFKEQGVAVTSIDLSPEHVALCREKGLEAHVMDILEMDFVGRTFDAAFPLNCLLHIPKADFAAALTAIRDVLRPGALFYNGQYGGEDVEGVSERDTYVPKRFFSRWTDEGLRVAVAEVFEVLDFRRIDFEDSKWSYQAVTARRS